MTTQIHRISDETIAGLADELCKHSEHALGKSAVRAIIRRHLDQPLAPTATPQTEGAELTPKDEAFIHMAKLRAATAVAQGETAELDAMLITLASGVQVLPREDARRIWRELNTAKAEVARLNQSNDEQYALGCGQAVELDTLRQSLAAVERERYEARELLADMTQDRDKAVGELRAAEAELVELRADKGRLEAFAKQILDGVKGACAGGDMGEEDEAVMEAAAKFGIGGVRRVKYDPALHGFIEEAEPGNEIWFWGSARQQEGRG